MIGTEQKTQAENASYGSEQECRKMEFDQGKMTDFLKAWRPLNPPVYPGRILAYLAHVRASEQPAGPESLVRRLLSRPDRARWLSRVEHVQRNADRESDLVTLKEVRRMNMKLGGRCTWFLVSAAMVLALGANLSVAQPPGGGGFRAEPDQSRGRRRCRFGRCPSNPSRSIRS